MLPGMSQTTTPSKLANARTYFEELPASMPKMARYQAVADRINAENPNDFQTSASSIAIKASKEGWLRAAAHAPKGLYQIIETIPKPTEADFANRLQNVARHTLVLAEGLVSAVPQWMQTVTPEKWSLDQGLRAMKAIPEFLNATIALDKVAEEMRLRHARQVGAGVPETATAAPPPIVEALESCNALIERARRIGG